MAKNNYPQTNSACVQTLLSEDNTGIMSECLSAMNRNISPLWYSALRSVVASAVGFAEPSAEPWDG